MRQSCPAKINLHLRVGRRREDGFHPLLTWMTTVGLFDTLTVEKRQLPHAGDADNNNVVRGDAPAGGEDMTRSAHTPPAVSARPTPTSPPGRERAGAQRILLLSSDLPGLPVDESNLVVRAAQAFAAVIAGCDAGEVGKRVAAERSGGGGRGSGVADSGSTPSMHVPAISSQTATGEGSDVSEIAARPRNV